MKFNYSMSPRGTFITTKRSLRWQEIASSREKHPVLAMTI